MSARAVALTLAAVLLLPVTAHAGSVLFPPETAACYVGAGAEMPGNAGRKAAVPVTAVRLQRGYPQLALEDKVAPRADGTRTINLRIIVTYADAGKKGGQKRYTNGLWHSMSCSAGLCDAGNYRAELQADGTVLLRMTGGLNLGGDRDRPKASRRLPDGSVYRLVASPMVACH